MVSQFDSNSIVIIRGGKPCNVPPAQLQSENVIGLSVDPMGNVERTDSEVSCWNLKQ